MKKALKIVSIIAVIAVVVAPLIGFAQAPKQAECCRLSQAIKMNDVTYGCFGLAVAADFTSGCAGHCLSAATGTRACQFCSGTINFPKGIVVGAGDCSAAAPANTCELKGVAENIKIESQEWGTICFLNSIYNVTNWIFFFFLAVAILIGVLAGYQFMIAAGDPGKVTKAKDLLLYMTIGLVIAAVAKVIPTLIRTVVGF